MPGGGCDVEPDYKDVYCWTPRKKQPGVFKVGDLVRVKTKVTHGTPARRGEKGTIKCNDDTGEGNYPWWVTFPGGGEHCYDADQLEHA